MNNIMFIIRVGFIRYSVVSALEVIRCNLCIVVNNEFNKCKIKLYLQIRSIRPVSKPVGYFEFANIICSSIY